MRPARFLLWLLPAFAGLAGALSAQSARSPFLPAAAAGGAPAASTEDASLQFCGVFGDGADKRFCIYDAATNRSVWVKLGQAGPDELLVHSYDLAAGTVVAEQGGQSLTLTLQVAKVEASTQARASTVVLTGDPKQDLVNTVKVNPTPSDERRRLEAVAAEVRRRRAARQAAASAIDNSAR